MKIDDFPDEIIERILNKLSSYRELDEAMCVCKKWNRIGKGIVQQRKKKIYNAVSRGCIHWGVHLPTGRQDAKISDRSSYGSCYHQLAQSFYVFGGSSGISGTCFNDLWRYDLGERAWHRPLAVGMYPPPKSHMTFVEYEENLILFGGLSLPVQVPLHQPANFFNDVHYLNIRTHQWTQIQFDIGPDPLAGHGACVCNDSMIIFGGLKAMHQCSDELWQFKISTRSWKLIHTSEPRPSARYGHTLLKLSDNKILIYGGFGGPNAKLQDFWLLDIKLNTWVLLQCENEELYGPSIQRENNTLRQSACSIGDKMLTFSIVTTILPVSNLSKNVNKGDSSSDTDTDTEQPRFRPQRDQAMPSIRPNAMRNREKQLEMLHHHAERIRQNRRHCHLAAPTERMSKIMKMHVLDLSRIGSQQVEWLPLEDSQTGTSHPATSFFSLGLCRGEVVMLGSCAINTSLEINVNKMTSLHFIQAQELRA